MEAIVPKASLISGLAKKELGVFVKQLTVGMHQSRRRLVRELLWGMLMSESVKLSRIAQWMTETSSKWLSRVKRLSRQLRGEWQTEPLRKNHLHLMSAFVGAETSIVVDVSDIRKDRGRKFEYLGKVYDGSTGEIATGYPFITVTAVLGKGRQVPLYLAPYSSVAPSFESENAELLRAVEAVVAAVGTKGVWVCDRGFDSRWFFNELARRQISFLICGYHDRKLVLHEAVQSLHSIVETLPLPLVLHVRGKGKKKRAFDVRYGAVKIQLAPYWDGQRRHHVQQELWLLVVEGYAPNKERTFFYTNVDLTTEEAKRQTVRRYADRWAVEEEIEFLKQQLHLEDLRVRAWQAIERLCLCALSAFAFLGRMLERFHQRRKRLIPILCSTQSDLDPDAVFLYYRIADALRLACSFTIAYDLWKRHR